MTCVVGSEVRKIELNGLSEPPTAWGQSQRYITIFQFGLKESQSNSAI
jgi:hypothetical protein